MTGNRPNIIRYTSYNEWDMIVREFGGGMWFWISLMLSLGFMTYVVRRLYIERTRPDATIYAALALFLVTVGSAIRAFLSWMQFMFELNGWDSRIWVETWPWFGLSVAMNITGSVSAIWLLSPAPWRTIFAVVSIIIAVVVPTWTFIYVR